MNDEQLDALAKKYTRIRDQTTHGWGSVPVAQLDHRAFARAVLSAVRMEDEADSRKSPAKTSGSQC